MENLDNNLENLNIDFKVKKNNFFLKFLLGFLFLVFLFLIYIFSLVQAPNNFKTGELFVLEEGSSLRALSSKLEKENYIKSRVLFESIIILLGDEKRVSPGDYIFKEKLNVFEIANRISKGEKGISRIKITIPEGFDTIEMAEIFEIKLHNFNKENFLKKSNLKEGYLFPDTYFFLSSDDEDRVLENMEKNFTKKTENIFEIFNSLDENTRNQKINDTIILASIIEKEASGDSDREIISGILQKRLKINMPLQVDAAPITYKERGLPEKPIANPGLEAINATLYPKTSNYLYYIHDKEGNTYFAETFKEHRANIEKYLK